MSKEIRTVEVAYASLGRRLALRFVRVFVSGFLTGALVVAPLAGFGIADLQTWLIALLAGGVTGGLTALEKALRE